MDTPPVFWAKSEQTIEKMRDAFRSFARERKSEAKEWNTEDAVGEAVEAFE